MQSLMSRCPNERSPFLLDLDAFHAWLVLADEQALAAFTLGTVWLCDGHSSTFRSWNGGRTSCSCARTGIDPLCLRVSRRSRTRMLTRQWSPTLMASSCRSMVRGVECRYQLYILSCFINDIVCLLLLNTYSLLNCHATSTLPLFGDQSQCCKCSCSVSHPLHDHLLPGLDRFLPPFL
jgi:hypothetical protein